MILRHESLRNADTSHFIKDTGGGGQGNGRNKDKNMNRKEWKFTVSWCFVFSKGIVEK